MGCVPRRAPDVGCPSLDRRRAAWRSPVGAGRLQRDLARSALVAAAVAGTDVFVGELGADASVELDRTGAEVVVTDVADVERIAALAAGQRTTAARALRRLGRGPLGGRLRLILVDRLPRDEVRTAFERIGVEVATAY